MNQILFKEQLAKDVYRIRVASPLIAEERQPGQFIILQLDTEYGERIPLTIADADVKEGSITLIFQAVGRSTRMLAELNVGDKIENLVGRWGGQRIFRTSGGWFAWGYWRRAAISHCAGDEAGGE